MSFENQQVSVTSKSDLSTWTGPGVLTKPDAVHRVRQDDDPVEFDTFDWTERMFRLGSSASTQNIPVGPGTPTFGYFDLPSILQQWIPYRDIQHKYYGFSYDSLEIRVTLSNPKNIVGGVHVGWMPYVDFFDENIVGTVDVWNLDELHQSVMINSSSQTQLMLFGNAQDVQFTIPWQFKYPLLPNWSFNLNERPPYGTPIVWWRQAPASAYVTSVLVPSVATMFCTVKGMKFYGPGLSIGEEKSSSKERTVFQSGLEGGMALLAEAGGVLVADKALSALNDMLTSDSAPTQGVNLDDEASTGNFDSPTSVQMSYFGDMASTKVSGLKSIFNPLQPDATSAPTEASEYLNRPQFIGHTTTSVQSIVIRGNPMFPITDTIVSPDKGTYFKYFSMVNRYWRGTLMLHAIIAGHPMVEVRVSASVSYPDQAFPIESTDFENFATYKGAFNGSKHLVFPMPFLSPHDYIPVVDTLNEILHESRDKLFSCMLHFRVEIVSTMLDVMPTIPVYFYMAAGPDFRFYQPYAPGLQNLEEEVTTLQVALPLDPEIASVRGATIPDPGILPAFNDMFDYMHLWSRALPFFDYRNGTDQEPILDASVGYSSPCWFPPVDRARDQAANNSWYFTLDYLSYFSILFLYWRGSISTKVAIATSDIRGVDSKYVYVTLGDPVGFSRAKVHCPFPVSPSTLPPNSNFGNGTIATPSDLQPVMEATIAYRGCNTFEYTIVNANYRGQMFSSGYGVPSASVKTNVLLNNQSTDMLADAMFRKAGQDFVLGVQSTLPPPMFWILRGGTWPTTASNRKRRMAGK